MKNWEGHVLVISPDFEVKSTISDYCADRDVEMEFVQQLIKPNRSIKKEIPMDSGVNSLGGVTGLQPVEVYAIEVDKQFNMARFNSLLKYVSPQKQERIKGFYHYEDALRALSGDLLVRYLICQKLNLKNHQLQFSQTEYGKPFLRNEPDFFYNISHSGEWVVCATAVSTVGIDIEKVASVDYLLAQRVLTAAEYQTLLTLNFSEQQRYFYSLWTLKESFIKTVGKGLSIPLDSFAVKINDGKHFTVHPEPNDGRYFFKQYDWSETYCLSVCATTDIFSDKVKVMTIDECENGLKINDLYL